MVGATEQRRYYGIAEIADVLGVDRQLVTVWRRRLSRGMPPPDEELAAGPLWTAATIEPWIRQTRDRLSRERSPSGPPSPELMRQAARRLLRLAAVAWEERPDPRVLTPALRAVEQLGELTAEGGDGDPARRLLRDIAGLPTAVGLVELDAADRGILGGQVVAALRAECLRLLPLMVRALNVMSGYGDAGDTGP
ncbi:MULTISPECIES: hypothetical protein [Frankia]|nr:MULTISPECIES: hypothetical protein [Frankia]